MDSPLKYFADLRDPRVERTREHLLEEILLMVFAAVLRIESERYHKVADKTEREIRYYITSLKPDARRLNQAIRQHWGIEDKLHWALDVSFGEDLDRKRQHNSAQNFSLLNRMALNLLRQDKTTKLGIKGKMTQSRLG